MVQLNGGARNSLNPGKHGTHAVASQRTMGQDRGLAASLRVNGGVLSDESRHEMRQYVTFLRSANLSSLPCNVDKRPLRELVPHLHPGLDWRVLTGFQDTQINQPVAGRVAPSSDVVEETYSTRPLTGPRYRAAVSTDTTITDELLSTQELAVSQHQEKGVLDADAQKFILQQAKQFEDLRQQLQRQQEQDLQRLIEEQKLQQVSLQREMKEQEARFKEQYNALMEQQQRLQEKENMQEFMKQQHTLTQQLVGQITAATKQQQGNMIPITGMTPGYLPAPATRWTQPDYMQPPSLPNTSYQVSGTNLNSTPTASSLPPPISHKTKHSEIQVTKKPELLPSALPIEDESEEESEESEEEISEEEEEESSEEERVPTRDSGPKASTPRGMNEEDRAWLNNPENKKRWPKAVALCQGWLVRRLMRVAKVQSLRAIISDGKIFLANMRYAENVRPGSTDEKDRELEKRVEAQLRGARLSLHDLFFRSTLRQKLDLIAAQRLHDLNRRMRQNSGSQGSSAEAVGISSATIRARERKLKEMEDKPSIKSDRLKTPQKRVDSGLHSEKKDHAKVDHRDIVRMNVDAVRSKAPGGNSEGLINCSSSHHHPPHTAQDKSPKPVGSGSPRQGHQQRPGTTPCTTHWKW